MKNNRLKKGFKPIEKRQLHMEIVDQLEPLILEGYYKKKLPSIKELASSLKVSGITVRKALVVLEQKKLISVKQGQRGIQVIQSNFNSLED